MSRNLCRTDCPRCGTNPIIDGPVHSITEQETGVYFGEYEGMLVANATCPLCGVKLLAWIDGTTRKNRVWRWDRKPTAEQPFFDLSYRSSFNDEPGQDDEPDSELWRMVEAYGGIRFRAGFVEAIERVTVAIAEVTPRQADDRERTRNEEMSEEISKKYGTASGGESYQLQTQGKINDAQKARKLEPKILVEIRMIDPEGKRVLGYVAADDPVMFEVQMTIEFEGRRYGLSKHYASLADWTGERLNFHVDNDIKQMVELLYALPCYPAYPEKP